MKTRGHYYLTLDRDRCQIKGKKAENTLLYRYAIIILACSTEFLKMLSRHN